MKSTFTLPWFVTGVRIAESSPTLLAQVWRRWFEILERGPVRMPHLSYSIEKKTVSFTWCQNGVTVDFSVREDGAVEWFVDDGRQRFGAEHGFEPEFRPEFFFSLRFCRPPETSETTDEHASMGEARTRAETREEVLVEMENFLKELDARAVVPDAVSSMRNLLLKGLSR